MLQVFQLLCKSMSFAISNRHELNLNQDPVALRLKGQIMRGYIYLQLYLESDTIQVSEKNHIFIDIG